MPEDAAATTGTEGTVICDNSRSAGSRHKLRQPASSIKARRLYPANLAPLRQRVMGYTGRILWIAADLLRHFPVRVFAVTSLHTLGVVIGAATISVVIVCAQQLAGDGTIASVDLPAIEEWTVVVISLIITVLGLTSAACVYFGEWAIARLMVAYHRECERRLSRIVTDADCRGWSILIDGSAISQIVKLNGVCCRTLVLSARRLLHVVLPFIMFVVAGTVLLATDWELALVLSPLGLIYSVPLYMVNRGAAKTHRLYQAQNPPVRRKINQTLKDHVADSRLPQGERTVAADAVLDNPSYLQAGLLFFRCRLLPEKTRFLNMIFFILAIAVLFMYAGFRAGGPDWSWSRVLIFLIALRFAVSGLQQITSTFILLSRFLPDYRQYIEFVQGAEQLKQSRVASRDQAGLPEGELTLRCGAGVIAGSVKRLTVPAPGPLWVLLPWKPSMADLDGVAVRLEKRARNVRDILSVSAVHVGDRFDADSAITFIGNLNQSDRDRLHICFDRLGVLDELAAVFDELPAGTENQAIDATALSREAAWALDAAGIFLDVQMVILAAAPLLRMKEPFVQRLAEVLADRYVVLVAQEPQAVLDSPLAGWSPENARVLVAGDRTMLGGGDLAWLADQREAVSKALMKHGPSRGHAGDEADALDEDGLGF